MIDIDDVTDLEKLLKLLREHEVTVYKQGDLLLQLAPKMPEFSEPDVSPAAQAGGWKRQADIAE